MDIQRLRNLTTGMWRRLMHWFGWNRGEVETRWDGDVLMVAFRCECGEVCGEWDSLILAEALNAEV